MSVAQHAWKWPGCAAVIGAAPNEGRGSFKKRSSHRLKWGGRTLGYLKGGAESDDQELPFGVIKQADTAGKKLF